MKFYSYEFPYAGVCLVVAETLHDAAQKIESRVGHSVNLADIEVDDLTENFVYYSSGE